MTTYIYIFTYYCYRAFVICKRGLGLNLADKSNIVTHTIDCCSPIALCLLNKRRGDTQQQT